MLNKKTCLLLGAGASAHLGFPLGLGLKDKMIYELNGIDTKKLKSYSISASIENIALWSSFRDEMSFTHYNSPDLFMEKRKNYIDIGKQLISYLLLKCENDSLENMRFSHGVGWYKIIRDTIQAETIDEFSNNKLSVITFNYDRTLEYYLHQYLIYQLRLSVEESWILLNKTIKIIHLHGSLGDLLNNPYGKIPVDLESTSRKIKIIGELNNDSDLDSFTLARDIMKDSDNLIVVGFGFNEVNVRRLDFFSKENLVDKEYTILIGQIYEDLLKGQLEYLSKFGINPRKVINKSAIEYFSYHNCF